MAFDKQVPTWGAPGVEPPESKKQEGWQVNDKPPAAWLNWFMSLTAESLKELQQKAAEKSDITTINSEIDGLKQSGVDGKNRLETAIIAKEGTVSKQSQVATFEELDTGIRSIPTGTDTSDATAAAGDLLAPKTAYGPSGKITGTIPVLTGIRNATGTAKWGDGALAVYPEKGYQKGGVGDGEIKVTTAQLKAAEPALASDKILSGNSIYGVPGGIPNRSAENNHMPGLESTVWPGDRFFIRPPHGFFNGSTWVTAAVPGLTAANLRKDVNVAGLIGTLMEGKQLFYAEYPGDGTERAINPGILFRAGVIYNDQGGTAGLIVTSSNNVIVFNSSQIYSPYIFYPTTTSFTLSTRTNSGTHYLHLYGR
ncbi:hypothetical protein [Paenibacillus sp. NPDC093718]|uniref:hypothetical protein n=1 Tax=Paenibacillus sp. NPDC093718 TaxID=3390601 RepID=UPI003CFE44D5